MQVLEHRRRVGLIGLALLGLLGCRPRSSAWGPTPSGAGGPVTTDAAIELLVIGQVRSNHATSVVASELDRRLDAATAERRAAMVIWLGLDSGPPGPERSGACTSLTEQTRRGPLAELGAVVEDAVTAGASSWGLPGPDLWRCGQLGAANLPYQQPGVAYVLRVDPSGTVELASSCDAASCELRPATGPVLVELVFLDLSYWVFPGLADEPSTAALLDQQRSLIAALASAPTTPRILVSPIPIESAGTRGLGGRMQRASFRYLPDFVQQAIAAGLFAGAIGGLERDLQLSADLSSAILRGDRSFIARPVFAVVSGSAGGAGHTAPTSHGGALLPDLWSERPGFARVLIGPAEVELVLHAHIGGRWQQASTRVALDRDSLPDLRTPPTIQPCFSCDPQQGASDREVFAPRVTRPR